jgi:hypothetical protein
LINLNCRRKPMGQIANQMALEAFFKLKAKI